MENTILTQIQDRHRLDILLLQFRQEQAENDAALRQARFDLREAKVAQTEYSGSFRSFRDKLTGKKEETETAMRHSIQRAETDLNVARQALERLALQIPEAEKQLDALPGWMDLKDLAQGDTLCQWHRMEAQYCAEAVSPLLEICHELLMERRNQFNGTYAGQLKTRQTLAEIYTAPEAAGEACKPYILRLKSALDALEIPFAPGSYFDNPTFFLSSATKYTRMDRVNEAISQVEQLQRTLPKLQKQLEA